MMVPLASQARPRRTTISPDIRVSLQEVDRLSDG